MSSLQIPPPQTALHLYRHLLREATYLPPVIKPFFVERVRTRFERHRRDPEPQYRIDRAHKDLRYLRAANSGDYVRMRRVLMLGFGRIGRRRRELIDDLVRRDRPTDTESLSKFIETPETTPSSIMTGWASGIPRRFWLSRDLKARSKYPKHRYRRKEPGLRTLLIISPRRTYGADLLHQSWHGPS